MSLAARNLRRLNHVKTAFFVCDIQDRFSTGIYSYPNLITTAQKLLSAAKVLDSRVIVTEQYPKVLGSTDKKLDISRAVINHPKTLFSMVTPEVQQHLNGVESVILFGIESHVCILQTCLDLLRQGIDVRVIVDGVSSANKSEIPTALMRMSAAGAILTTSDCILFELMTDSKNPKFKEISAIVKEHLVSTKANPLGFSLTFATPRL